MAVDPTELAEEQEARQRITAAGAPTEFAKGPEAENRIELAGGFGAVGDVFRILNNPDVSTSVKPSMKPLPGAATPPPSATLPSRVPTPQEEPIVKRTDPMFKYKDVQRKVAPSVLTPPQLEEFRGRGFQGMPPVEAQNLEQARAAADAEAEEVARNTQDLINGSKAVVGDEAGKKVVTSDDLVGGDFATSVLERLQNIDGELKDLKDGGTFNFDKIETETDVQYTLDALAQELQEETEFYTRGIISQEQTREKAMQIIAADELGFTQELLNRKVADGSLNAEKTVAARILLTRSAIKVRNMPKAEAEALARNANTILAENGGKELNLETVKRFNKLAKSENPIGAINRFSALAYLKKGKEILHHAWMAGLLSNAATQIKAIVGTASYMAFQTPAEFIGGIYGAGIRSSRSALGLQNNPEQIYMRDVLFRYNGWLHSFSDSWRAGKIAFMTDMPSSGANRYDLEVYNPVGEAEETFFSKSLSITAKATRAPFSFLLGGDEFFKVMSARGELYTAVSRRYSDVIAQGKTREEAIAEANMLLLDPRAVETDLDLVARYNTMQADLGRIGKGFKEIQKIPFASYIFPFVQAPTNTIVSTLKYTPVGMYKALAPKLIGGAKTPKEQQLALGRVTLGAGIMALVSRYGHDGIFTGPMPESESARAALPDNWQPFSVAIRGDDFPRDKNGNFLPRFDEFGVPNGPLTYYSYAGFEPVGAILGLALGYNQKVSEMPPFEFSGEYFYSLAAAGSATISEYALEMPMLQGMADLVSAINHKDADRLLRSYFTSANPIVPLPNPFSSLQRAGYDLYDPAKVRPREDTIEYYTMADVEETYTDDQGKTKRVLGSTPSGKPKYHLVGAPKDGTYKQKIEIIQSYLSQDSFFKDQYDLNAAERDNYGNIVNSTQINFATDPTGAIRNRVLGVRIVPAEQMSEVEKYIISLYAEIGAMPIANKRTLNGIKINWGAQQDWTKLAKGEYDDGSGNMTRLRIPVPQLGSVTLSFNEALEMMITGKYTYPSGDEITDFTSGFKTKGWREQAEMIANLNDLYYDSAIPLLWNEMDSKGNFRHLELKDAYDSVVELKDKRARGEIE